MMKWQHFGKPEIVPSFSSIRLRRLAIFSNYM